MGYTFVPHPTHSRASASPHAARSTLTAVCVTPTITGRHSREGGNPVAQDGKTLGPRPRLAPWRQALRGDDEQRFQLSLAFATINSFVWVGGTSTACLMQTDRLRLEPLVEGHAIEMFDALSDPQIYSFIPDKPPLSIAALRQRYQMLQRGTSRDGSQLWLNWVIRLVSSDRCIGYVQATVHAARTADFAYVLASAFWGRGIATEACVAVIDFLDTELAVQSLYATVAAENDRSVRLLARLGFVELVPSRYPHGKVVEGDRVFCLALDSRHAR